MTRKNDVEAATIDEQRRESPGVFSQVLQKDL